MKSGFTRELLQNPKPPLHSLACLTAHLPTNLSHARLRFEIKCPP